MTADALDALRQYHWPGNVRELRNLVERVLILNPKLTRIDRKHLPMLVSPRDPRRQPTAGPRRRVLHPARGPRSLRARLHPQESSKSATATSAAPPKPSASNAATSTAR